MAVPANAPAAVTIGEDTSSPGPTAPGACGIPSGCTYANLEHPTRQLAVPFDGVIVRWRVQGGGSPVPFTPRVVRPLPGGSFVGAGTGAPETIVGGAERTIPTRLPVKAGDLFGLDVADGGAIRAYNPLPGARFAGWFMPLLADGGTGQLPNSISSPSWSLIYNADVEPDCDGDGFGDETQDSDVSQCAKRASMKVRGRVKVKSAGDGRFTVLTGIDASCPPAAGGNCTGLATVKRASGASRLASHSLAPKKLGAKKLSVAVGRTVRVKVKLTGKASEALREEGVIRAKVAVRLSSPADALAATSSRSTKLKAPGG
jgi:hypothetical protein